MCWCLCRIWGFGRVSGLRLSFGRAGYFELSIPVPYRSRSLKLGACVGSGTPCPGRHTLARSKSGTQRTSTLTKSTPEHGSHLSPLPKNESDPRLILHFGRLHVIGWRSRGIAPRSRARSDERCRASTDVLTGAPFRVGWIHLRVGHWRRGNGRHARRVRSGHQGPWPHGQRNLRRILRRHG